MSRTFYITPAASRHTHIDRWLSRIPPTDKIVFCTTPLPDTHQANKNTIIIDVHKGNFIKPFNQDSADVLITQPEHYIALSRSCLFNCSYCYLTGYLGIHKAIILYINYNDFENELYRFTDTLPVNKKAWLNAGELSDSFLFDHITEYVPALIETFRPLKKCTLELRTKDNAIKPLLNIPPSDNTVIAWSLNPPSIINQYELGTASLEERLTAAQHVQRHGFRIAFRIDPMLHVADWRTAYLQLTKQIHDYFKPGDIDFIAVGAFRYPTAMEHSFRQSPRSHTLISDEMITGIDGKRRYFRSIRRELFSGILPDLQKLNTRLFLCMETKQMWHDVRLNLPNRYTE